MNQELRIITAQIEKLEAKRDNGTITMDEETLLCRLCERADEILFG